MNVQDYLCMKKYGLEGTVHSDPIAVHGKNADADIKICTDLAR